MVKQRLSYVLGADFLKFGPLVSRVLTLRGQDEGTFNLYLLFKKYILGLKNYYELVNSNFNLSSLFPLAWLITLVSAIKGSKSNKIMLVALLLFSPVMVFLSISGWMLRQGMIIFDLSYIVLASSILAAGSYVLKAVRNIRKNGRFLMVMKWIGVIVISSFIVGQIWMSDGRGNKTSRYLVENSYFVRKTIGKDTKWEIKGKHSEGIKLTGKWITDNVPPGSKLMTDADVYDAVYFFTDGAYPVHSIPHIAVAHLIPSIKEKLLTLRSEHEVYSYPVEKLLFLWSAGNTSDPGWPLYASFEEFLLDKLNALSIKYVIIGPRMNFLSLYFQDNPCFKLVTAFDRGGVKIFEVKNIRPKRKVEVRIGSKLPIFLRNVQDTDQERYECLVQGILKPYLNMDEGKIQKMVEEAEESRKQYAYVFHRRNDGYAIIRTHKAWRYVMQNDAGSTFSIVGGPIHVNKWTHLALVYDGRTLRVYENGEEVGKSLASGTIEINDGPLYIGSDVPKAERFFRGIIDEVKIYKNALKPSEFNLPHKTEELVAYWKFDEDSKDRVFDSSRNGNDGIINGANYVRGFSGTGLFFDGNDDYILVPDNDSLDGMSELTVEMWVYPQPYRTKVGGLEMVEFNQHY